MPTALGHAVVGIGLGAYAVSKRRTLRDNIVLTVTLAVVSVFPDLDVIAFSFGIPYHHPFGHRGVGHSLIAAAIISLFFWSFMRWDMNLRAENSIGLRELAVATIVAVSHPLLDMLTNGGLGIAVFAPFSFERHFFPIELIPVSPIGLTKSLLPILYFEAKLFVPMALGLWISRWFLNRCFRQSGEIKTSSFRDKR